MTNHTAYRLPPRADGLPRLSARDVSWDPTTPHPVGTVVASAPWCVEGAAVDGGMGIPARVALVCVADGTVLEEVVLTTWAGYKYVGRDSMGHPYQIRILTPKS